jgi:tripartite ATP-independent transporter DctP family solute receptor
MRHLGCAFGAFFLALVAVLPAAARDFRSSDVYPLDYPTVQAVVHVAKLLHERSAGRLGINVTGQDDQDSEAYTIAELRNGTLDMARVNLAGLNTIAPETVVPVLPYLFKSPAHARRILDGPIGDEILASLAAHGLIGLCFYASGPRHLYSSTRPIRTPADLKGLKVRVQASDTTWAEMISALGAEPVSVPTDRLYISLKAGVIDAAEHNLPSYVSMHLYRVARYFSLTGHSMAPSVLVFSKRIWDTLPAADQAMIRSAAKDSVPVMRRLWDEREAADRRQIEAAGGEIVDDVDRKAFVDALLPLYPTIIRDARLLALARRIQNEE